MIRCFPRRTRRCLYWCMNDWFAHLVSLLDNPTVQQIADTCDFYHELGRPGIPYGRFCCAWLSELGSAKRYVRVSDAVIARPVQTPVEPERTGCRQRLEPPRVLTRVVPGVAEWRQMTFLHGFANAVRGQEGELSDVCSRGSRCRQTARLGDRPLRRKKGAAPVKGQPPSGLLGRRFAWTSAVVL